jgi:FtsP/CotA-like multicopper oxidase with cupredoxin domain
VPRPHPLSRWIPAALAALGVLAAAGPARSSRLAARAATARTVELTLTAAPARLALRDDVSTEVWAYNGTVPGPTLELREGDRVVVHFRNALPEPSTIHRHGLSLPFVSDGSPFHPVPPGGRHDYAFTVARGTAGTYWYHPHPDHRTGDQVARGLYGAIVVRAADDPLPAALPERLLVLSDNRFRPDGALDLAAPGTPAACVDAENGREGDAVFVGGRVLPTLTIRSGEVQRWRLVNASAARVYRLTIPGHGFVQVGSDGGLFERPVARGEIVLGAGERVEGSCAAPGRRARARRCARCRTTATSRRRGRPPGTRRATC